MPVDRRSRYAGSGRVPWVRADGSAVELVAPTPRPARPAAVRPTASDTDRLDTLAASYYRDPRKLWRIADAADALDPFDAVIPGDPIDIPADR